MRIILSSSLGDPDTRKHNERREIPGSTAFVPSVAGLIIAGEVVRDLAEYRRPITI